MNNLLKELSKVVCLLPSPYRKTGLPILRHCETEETEKQAYKYIIS